MIECSFTNSVAVGSNPVAVTKTPALTKNMNMDNWIVGTSNQLFIRGSYAEKKFPKKRRSYWRNSVLCDRSISYSPFYLS